MMNEFESSPTKSVATLPETDDEITYTAKKSLKSKSSNSNSNRTKTSAPQRPPAKPLTGNVSGSGRLNSGSGAGGFMTQAERSKIDAKEKKAAEQDCFEFLRDLKDVSATCPPFPPALGVGFSVMLTTM